MSSEEKSAFSGTGIIDRIATVKDGGVRFSIDFGAENGELIKEAMLLKAKGLDYVQVAIVFLDKG